jgi:hypothetical protein
VAARLEPQEAARACGQAVATLTEAISNTLDSNGLQSLARGLAAIVAYVEPKEAATAAATITEVMNKTTDPNVFVYLSFGLSALASRLEPQEAARVCGRAAATLTEAMTPATSPFTLSYLAEVLSAVVVRLEPREAARVCGHAVTTIIEAMNRVCGHAVTTIIEAMNRTMDPNVWGSLSLGLSAVAARLPPKEAAQARGLGAATLIQAISKTTDPTALGNQSWGLSRVLGREPATFIAQPTPELLPLLPSQTLVDLLKHPFCVGEPRHLVLEQLTRHYHRPFADQWEFVEYVTSNKLPLDLTTPALRPK